MSELTRRDALRSAAAMGVAAASTAVLTAQPSHANEGRRFAKAQDRWQGHQTEQVPALRNPVKPFPVSMGVQPPGDRPLALGGELREALTTGYAPLGAQPYSDYWAAPRLDLNGLRVKTPQHPEVYLIDRGFRRWIPDLATYYNLFRDAQGIVVDVNVDEIPLGPSISSGALLARAAGYVPIYLIDGGMRRWIAGPPIMDQYYFAWDRVYVLPAAMVHAIPQGPTLDG